MKKRYIYSLLFGIPGFFVAVIISFVIFGFAAGVFWLFVFGDNTWPSSTGAMFSVLWVFTFMAAWIAIIWIGFTTGKRLEKDPQLNKMHVLVSGGLTLLFVLFIVFQQFRVGNLGPRSDSELCNDYCTLNGYSASGMSSQDSGDRTCSCFDDLGNEALKIPLDSIELESSK